MRFRFTHRRAHALAPLLAACLTVLASCGNPTTSDDEGVERVDVTPASLELVEGETRTLVARVFGPGGAQIVAGTIFWSSRDPSVATVDQDGLLTAVAEGTTQVAASVGGVSGLADVTVERQPASHLDVVTEPSAAAQNGLPFPRQPVVQLVDASNRPVARAGVTITASLAGGNGTLSGTLSTLTDANGAATFTNLTITGTAPAQYTLRFSGSGLIDATSASIALAPGPAARLVLTTPPSSTAQSGVPFAQQPVLRVQDASGNNAPQAGIQVTAAIASGPGTLGGALTVNTNGSGVATFANLQITGAAGARTLAFSAPSLTGVTSPPINVTAGAASQLVLVSPPSSSASSGTPLAAQPVVQLQDGSGNNVAQAGVVVTASVTPGGVTLSGQTATTNAGGTAAFSNLTLTGASGTYSLSFGASGFAPTQSVNVTLGAGSGSQLVVFTQPSASVQAGTIFSGQPVIQLRDASNNDVAQAGVAVTAAIASGSGTLGGTVTVNTNASGQASFTDLVITGTAGPHTLNFSASGYTGTTSTTINVTAGPLAQLGISVQPSAAAQSGIVFPQQPVVQLLDAWNNPVAQSNVPITVTIASGGGTLGGTTTVDTDASGAASFTDLVITGTVGDRTLTFSDGTHDVTSGTISLGAGAPVTIAVITQPSAVAVNGVAFGTQPVIEVRDGAGNVVSGVTVTASITPGPAGTLDGTPSAVTDGSGLATFTDLAITRTGIDALFTLDFTVQSVTPALSVTSAAIVVF